MCLLHHKYPGKGRAIDMYQMCMYVCIHLCICMHLFIGIVLFRIQVNVSTCVTSPLCISKHYVVLWCFIGIQDVFFFKIWFSDRNISQQKGIGRYSNPDTHAKWEPVLHQLTYIHSYRENNIHTFVNLCILWCRDASTETYMQTYLHIHSRFINTSQQRYIIQILK